MTSVSFAKKATPHQAINIGSYRVKQIKYEQIEPGDLVCTFEALSTNPKILTIVFFQKCIKLRNRGELNKMFHFEAVVGKYPRKGIYRIAHVNGSLGQVVSQDDNFKSHHPGQAFIVFRAKHKEVQKEIIAVARNTSQPDNGHLCARLPFSTGKIIRAIPEIGKCFIFENFIRRASNAKLRQIVQMTLDYIETNKFYDRDRARLLKLSCPQYIANIINVSMISVLFRNILENSNLSREKRIQLVFNKTLELYGQPNALLSNFPFNCSSSSVTAAYLVNALLENPQHFECVGYLGHIYEGMDQPIQTVRQKQFFISDEKLFQKLIPQKQPYLGLNPNAIGKILRILRIISDEGRLYVEASRDRVKAQTAFICIYALSHSISLQNATETLANSRHDLFPLNDLNVFAEKMGALCDEADENEGVAKEMSGRGTSLRITDTMVLDLEKKVIKEENLDRTRKTFNLSMNALAKEKVKYKRMRFIAEKCMSTADFFKKAIILYPISYIFSFFGQKLFQHASQRETKIESTTNALINVYQRAHPTGYIGLNASIEKGSRPWIHFSIDAGETWDQEPFLNEEDTWSAYVCLPHNTNLIYKIFIGPENKDTPNPLSEIRAWQKTFNDQDTFVSWDSCTPKERNHNTFLLLDTCIDPTWEWLDDNEFA